MKNKRKTEKEMEKKIVLNRLACLIGLIALLAIAGLFALAGDWLKEKLLALYQDKGLCLLILAVLFTLFAWFLVEAESGRWTVVVLSIAYVFLTSMLWIATKSIIVMIISLAIVTFGGLLVAALAPKRLFLVYDLVKLGLIRAKRLIVSFLIAAGRISQDLYRRTSSYLLAVSSTIFCAYMICDYRENPFYKLRLYDTAYLRSSEHLQDPDGHGLLLRITIVILIAGIAAVIANYLMIKSRNWYNLVAAVYPSFFLTLILAMVFWSWIPFLLSIMLWVAIRDDIKAEKKRINGKIKAGASQETTGKNDDWLYYG